MIKKFLNWIYFRWCFFFKEAIERLEIKEHHPNHQQIDKRLEPKESNMININHN
jgi:hypothetical protein